MGDKNKELQLKEEVLTYYGKGCCQCVKCGFSNISALCLDHIKGDGRYAVTRRAGITLYRHLKNTDFPSGFQTLCFNCNIIKARDNSETGTSAEFRALKSEAKLRRESRIYRYQTSDEDINNWASMLYFEKYINKLSFFRFSLNDIYTKLQLGETKRALLRATCLKLIRQEKLKRIGRGRYERIVARASGKDYYFKDCHPVID